MQIELEKGIIIFSDESQFQLRKEVGVDKKGKTTFKTLGYYSTLEQALNGYVKYATRLSEATSIRELREDLKEIKATIKNYN